MIFNEVLNRHRKIKAYSILLAWMVIFLHNVIPHHHHDEQPFHCHSLFHKTAETEQCCTHETKFKGAGENNTVICHFSPVFCHPQNFGEAGLPDNSSSVPTNILCRSEIVHLPGCKLFYNPPGYDSNHLRAPPLS